MPNLKGAIKRTRQNEQRRILNTSQKSAARNAMKNVELAIDAQDKEKAAAAFKDAIKKLDKVGNKGLLHRNKINRYKSQITKKYNEFAAQ